MSTQGIRPPKRLTFLDNYGKQIATIVICLLFLISLGGYIYLNYFNDVPDITDTILQTAEYKVIAIHKESIRPGQTDNTITFKLIPESSMNSVINLKIKVSDINPTFVIVKSDLEEEFTIPNEQAQMQINFDLTNNSDLPEKLEFQTVIVSGTLSLTAQSVYVNVSKISGNRFALLSTAITGLLSLWLLFGQEIIKYLFKEKKSK